VLISDARGAHIPAEGFSFPYLLAMALGTAFYGFLGLLLSYSLARKYVAAHWAFLATLEIWARARSPCTCISIQRGPTRNPPSPSPFFSGSWTARGAGAPLWE
jgi:hypothetical protein